VSETRDQRISLSLSGPNDCSPKTLNTRLHSSVAHDASDDDDGQTTCNLACPCRLPRWHAAGMAADGLTLALEAYQRAQDELVEGEEPAR
jgi:hypothetical protein